MLGIEDPAQMREHIRQAAMTGCRVDTEPADQPWLNVVTPASNLANRVLNMQRHGNLSDLDTMTMLAFHALQMVEHYSDQCLRDAMLAPAQKLFFIDPAQNA